MKQRLSTWPAAHLVALILFGCGGSGSPTAPVPTGPCGEYSNWATSDYVLPYEVGSTFKVQQGNCTSPESSGWNSHQESGPWAFAYDFRLPKGTPIVATRAGTVIWAFDGNPDRANADGNSVVIEHADGTFAGYGHIGQGGALTVIGQAVAQGQRIALSGSSGTDIPHLHFHVSPCTDVDFDACKSLPVNFRNTSPNPHGLVRGQFYEALPY